MILKSNFKVSKSNFKSLAGGSTLDLHKDLRINEDFCTNILPRKRNSKLNPRTKLNIIEKIIKDRFDTKEVAKIYNVGVSTVYLIIKDFSLRGMNAIIDKK